MIVFLAVEPCLKVTVQLNLHIFTLGSVKCSMVEQAFTQDKCTNQSLQCQQSVLFDHFCDSAKHLGKVIAHFLRKLLVQLLVSPEVHDRLYVMDCT